MEKSFYEELLALIDMVHDEAVADGDAFSCGEDIQPDCIDSLCRSYPNCDRAKRVDEKIKELRQIVEQDK
jgi:hypothetical protein